jgi:L-fuculose-phosphate aldolase
MQSKLVGQIVDICHRLYEKNLLTATDGNVSARLPNGNILATRSGINKGMVTDQDLVEMTLDGRQVGGKGKPSTELGMHRYIYLHRSDAQAVVHAHPTYATGFAAAGKALDQCLLPEVIVSLGSIPLARYGTPSTPELAESLSPYIASHQAILLMNHGAVTFGATLLDAYFKMEKVEHAAHIAFVATMLGGPQPLPRDQVEKLRGISTQSYGKETGASCVSGPEAAADDIPDDRLRSYIEEAIRKRLS